MRYGIGLLWFECFRKLITMTSESLDFISWLDSDLSKPPMASGDDAWRKTMANLVKAQIAGYEEQLADPTICPQLRNAINRRVARLIRLLPDE